MTVYWCGGEDVDWTGGTAWSVSTTTSSRRTAYSRAAISLLGAESQNRWSPYLSGEVTDCWIMDYVMVGNSASYRLFGMYNSTTTDWIGVGFNGTNKISFCKKTGAGATTHIASEATATWDTANAHKIDLHLVYAESGEAQIYVDGALKVNFTGNTLSGTATYFNQMSIFGATSGTAYSSGHSEFICQDTSTLNAALLTLAPNAAGDVSGEWTGAYTAIDETGWNDTDLVYTTSSGENNIWQCNLTGWPTGDWICRGVKLTYRAADGIGGFGVYGGIETNSNLYSGELETPSSAFASYEVMWQNNPYTDNRFTSGEINALQFMFKAVGV